MSGPKTQNMFKMAQAIKADPEATQALGTRVIDIMSQDPDPDVDQTQNDPDPDYSEGEGEGDESPDDQDVDNEQEAVAEPETQTMQRQKGPRAMYEGLPVCKFHWRGKCRKEAEGTCTNYSHPPDIEAFKEEFFRVNGMTPRPRDHRDRQPTPRYHQRPSDDSQTQNQPRPRKEVCEKWLFTGDCELRGQNDGCEDLHPLKWQNKGCKHRDNCEYVNTERGCKFFHKGRQPRLRQYQQSDQQSNQQPNRYSSQPMPRFPDEAAIARMAEQAVQRALQKQAPANGQMQMTVPMLQQVQVPVQVPMAAMPMHQLPLQQMQVLMPNQQMAVPMHRLQQGGGPVNLRMMPVSAPAQAQAQAQAVQKQGAKQTQVPTQSQTQSQTQTQRAPKQAPKQVPKQVQSQSAQR